MFSERLKELRISRGLTQKDLGKIIGATYSAISYWELGINEPKLSYIIALIDFFDVDFDYLIGRTD